METLIDEELKRLSLKELNHLLKVVTEHTARAQFAVQCGAPRPRSWVAVANHRA